MELRAVVEEKGTSGMSRVEASVVVEGGGSGGRRGEREEGCAMKTMGRSACLWMNAGEEAVVAGEDVEVGSTMAVLWERLLVGVRMTCAS